MAEAVGIVTAPAAGLAALALYFGWKRTQVYATYFGIDNSILSFSVQEYVLRSARPVYQVVLSTVIMGLGVLALHSVLSRHLGTRAVRGAGSALVLAAVFLLLIWMRSPANRLLGHVEPVAQATAAASCAVVLVAEWRFHRWRSQSRRSEMLFSVRATVVLLSVLLILDAGAVPATTFVRNAPYISAETVLAFGIAALLYAAYLNRSIDQKPRDRAPTWVRTLFIVLTALLVAAGLFAATDEFAESVGIEEAELTAVRIEGRRGVVVYTKEELNLPPDVECAPLTNRVSIFKYRCEGLRLFVQSEKGTLVMPKTWSRDDGIDENDRILVLIPSESIRLEFTPGEDDLPDQPR